MTDDAISLLRDAMSDLRCEVGLLQTEVASARRDIATIEARHMALETWRGRFEMQVATAQDRFVGKSDELVKELSRFHADLAQFRGEQSGGASGYDDCRWTTFSCNRKYSGSPTSFCDEVTADETVLG